MHRAGLSPEPAEPSRFPDPWLAAAHERSRFLDEAGRSLHGVLHPDRTLRRAAALAVPRLAPLALVLLADGPVVRWSWADAARPGHASRPPAGALALGAVGPRLREALTVDGAGELTDPWLADEVAALDVGPRRPPVSGRSLRVLGVPVVPAVLVLVGAGDDDPEESLLVQEFSARVGAALAAAVRHREQADVADVLQDSLAPVPLPRVDGLDLGSAFRPARDGLRVGGDFYEVVAERSGPGAFLVLGDVCGKGVEAAVLTGRVRQSLHALRLVERGLVPLLTLLNTALLDAAPDPERVRFATMVVGEARPTADGGVVVRLAAGGHPPPLVRRADGRVEEVALSGSLVGGVRAVRFTEVEVVLAPGDVVLLYSDGVVEARGDREAGFFGEERLARALAACAGAPAEVVAERILQRVIGWLDGHDHDDVAVLAVGAPA